MARRPRLALIDDEVDLTSGLGEYLRDLGYDVDTASSVESGRALIDRTPVDLVVLDLNMPGENGLSLLRSVREDRNHRLPVIILTANLEPVERIIGLEIGADDFVVKPVDPRELAARIGGLLRRFGTAGRELVALERSTVDLTASRLLTKNSPPERLGPGEVVLLRAFAQNAGRVMTRDELLEIAPAESLDAEARSIDQRVARLRRKLDTDAIVTVPGRGYMFVAPELDLGDRRAEEDKASPDKLAG